MPVRIYDIAKKLGIESKEVLVKAKELGITAARVPSSSLDKITAEYLVEKLGGVRPTPPPAAPPSVTEEKIVIVSEPPRSVAAVEATPVPETETEDTAMAVAIAADAPPAEVAPM